MFRALLIMGVSGTGKTTVGRLLAQELGWAFVDADDYHSAQNRAKMASGVPLTDEDRWPWLERLRGIVEEHAAAGRPMVLACSALKESYRRLLRRGLEDRFPVAHLTGPADLIRSRMAARESFMKPGMLDSQLAALEPPAGAITVGIERPVEEVVGDIRRRLGPLAHG